MDVHSLGLRTNLALLELNGSEIEDRGDHVVVRTPTSPDFYWGNFLLIAAPPTAAELDGWLDAHQRAFPGARHATLAIDRPDLGDVGPLRRAGLRLDVPVAMTATQVTPPPHPNTEAELRTLTNDADWSGQIDLVLACEDSPHVTPEFVSLQVTALRALVEDGHGHWWGGFVAGRLVSSLGIFRAGEDLARFQSVNTHPDFRGRGLAGTLVHRASREALDELGALALVMVADPDYLAIRVYRSVGFVDGGSHAEVTRFPAS